MVMICSSFPVSPWLESAMIARARLAQQHVQTEALPNMMVLCSKSHSSYGIWGKYLQILVQAQVSVAKAHGYQPGDVTSFGLPVGDGHHPSLQARAALREAAELGKYWVAAKTKVV